MRRTARHLKAELHGKLDAALPMGTGALVATAFLAVGREGLETALFVWASVRRGRRRHARPADRRRCSASPRRSCWAGSSTAARCGSTSPSSSPGPAACWSSWRRVSSRTASTTSRRREFLGGLHEQGVRHQRDDPAGQLVRHAAEGRSSTSSRTRRSSRCRCGCCTWRRCSSSSCGSRHRAAHRPCLCKTAANGAGTPTGLNTCGVVHSSRQLPAGSLGEVLDLHKRNPAGFRL